MSDWPFEIITSIFCHLVDPQDIKKESLKQCALTCRNWSLAARPLLFSNIYITSDKELGNLFLATVRNETLANYVKVLDTEWFKKLEYTSFYLIAKLFVNLEEFYFGHEGLSFGYLYEMLKGGAFPRLKKFTNPIYDQFRLYSECVKIQQYVISSIALDCRGSYLDLYDKLDQFPNLEEVQVEHRIINVTQLGPLDNMELILQQTHALSIKSYSFTFREELGLTKLSVPLDTIQPMPNVNRLKINILTSSKNAIIDDTFMLYVMKRFPNLTTFTAMTDDDCYIHDKAIYPDLSEDITVKFLQYISKIPNSNVSPIATVENTAKILNKYFTNKIETETSKELEPFTLTMIFTQEKEQEEIIQQPILRIVNPNNRVYVRFFNNPIGPDDTGRTKLELIEQTGQFFQNIVLEKRFLAVEISDCQLISHIAKYGARLRSMIMLKLSFPEMTEPEDLTPNHTLIKLQLEYCVVPSNTFSTFSKLFPNLKELIMVSHMIKRSDSDRILMLTLPNVSLDHLSLAFQFDDYYDDDLDTKEEFLSTPRFNRICVKLHDNEKVEYLVVDVLCKFVEVATADKFENEIQDNPLFYICDIRCKSLKKLTLNRCGVYDTYIFEQ